MELKATVQTDNSLEATLTDTNYNTPFNAKSFPEFVINGVVVFQMKFVCVNEVFNGLKSLLRQVSVQFRQRRANNNIVYNIKFTSNELGIKDKCFTSDDGTWHIVYENSKSFTHCNFVVHISVPSASSFGSLHDDTELTDFELRGKDGSVHVHRAVLAAASAVLRRLLGGVWRETCQGFVEVPGASRATLEHLKNYVYLQTLPATGLEDLLLLASCYLITDLEQNCVDKLVLTVNAKNACDLIEFATKHKMCQLLLAVLERVQSGAIKVADMRDNLKQTQ